MARVSIFDFFRSMDVKRSIVSYLLFGPVFFFNDGEYREMLTGCQLKTRM
jgi:hypothetical protein